MLNPRILIACSTALLTAFPVQAEETRNDDVQHRLELLELRVAELEKRLGTWDKPKTDPETEQALAVHPGKAMFESLCMACHKAQPSPPMLAPPVFAMKDHYLRVHPDKKDFVPAVVKWVKTPNEQDSLMPGARRKFGLMPPLPLPDAQLTQIADYLFENNFAKPGWYDAHYKAEHGNKKPNE